LCRGWLESASDTEGRIGYRVTPAGLSQRLPRATKLPGYDLYAGEEYDELFAGALAERDSWEVTDLSLVFIPLSAGRWPQSPNRVKP
jgi:hypothetical protein